MTMRWYYWDTNIGQALACAASADAARAQLLTALPAGDAARDELAEAFKAQPKINYGEACAVMAWRQ